MSSRVRVLHEWMRQVEALEPQARVTRVRVLAGCAAGMLWANAMTPLEVAAMRSMAATDPSLERRLRHLLANSRVTVATLWQPLPPVLPRRLGAPSAPGLEPMPYCGEATILVVGVVVRHRVLPLLWRIMPQQEPWQRSTAAVSRSPSSWEAGR